MRRAARRPWLRSPSTESARALPAPGGLVNPLPFPRSTRHRRTLPKFVAITLTSAQDSASEIPAQHPALGPLPTPAGASAPVHRGESRLPFLGYRGRALAKGLWRTSHDRTLRSHPAKSGTEPLDLCGLGLPTTLAVPDEVRAFECFDRWHEATGRQASEERLRRHDLLSQPDPRLIDLSFGERAHYRCRAYRRPGSLAAAHHRSPNPATRSFDLHGDSVPVAPLVPATQPRVEALDSFLCASPAPEHRCHP